LLSSFVVCPPSRLRSHTFQLTNNSYYKNTYCHSHTATSLSSSVQCPSFCTPVTHRLRAFFRPSDSPFRRPFRRATLLTHRSYLHYHPPLCGSSSSSVHVHSSFSHHSVITDSQQPCRCQPLPTIRAAKGRGENERRKLTEMKRSSKQHAHLYQHMCQQSLLALRPPPSIVTPFSPYCSGCR
jgi:hypothetical protein